MKFTWWIKSGFFVTLEQFYKTTLLVYKSQQQKRKADLLSNLLVMITRSRIESRIPVVRRELVSVRRKSGEGGRRDERVWRVCSNVMMTQHNWTFHDRRGRWVRRLRRRRTRPEAASAASARRNVWKKEKEKNKFLFCLMGLFLG